MSNVSHIFEEVIVHGLFEVTVNRSLPPAPGKFPSIGWNKSFSFDSWVILIMVFWDMPSASIVNVATREASELLSEMFTEISSIRELEALMAGVGIHQFASLIIVQGVFELILKTMGRGDVANTVYSACASVSILGGKSPCESIDNSWQETKVKRNAAKNRCINR